MYYHADIGVIGGSGFYEIADKVKHIEIDTQYGKPSDYISLIEIEGKIIAFLPRHGLKHIINPGEINYRANVDAMAQLGVKAIISACCVGSLNPKMAPGDFVITDQYINMTSGRKESFFKSPEVCHLSSADPYDDALRQAALLVGRKLGLTVHDQGTTVVINGPRFSTRAESKMFAGWGADIVNMTQYPEAYLCMEKGLPVVNIALVSDYDTGLEGQPDIPPVSAETAGKVIEENQEMIKQYILALAESIGA